MLMAMLAAYFLSGGLAGVSGSTLTAAVVKQLSEQVQTIVAEPARLDAARETLKVLGKEVKVFEKMFRRSGRQLTKSYKDHAADRDEALSILADLNAGWERSQQRALDLRFELRGSLSEEQWSALFAGD